MPLLRQLAMLLEKKRIWTHSPRMLIDTEYQCPVHMPRVSQVQTAQVCSSTQHFPGQFVTKTMFVNVVNASLSHTSHPPLCASDLQIWAVAVRVIFHFFGHGRVIAPGAQGHRCTASVPPSKGSLQACHHLWVVSVTHWGGSS